MSKYVVTARYVVEQTIVVEAKAYHEAKGKAYNQLIDKSGINEKVAADLETIGLRFDHVCNHIFWDIEKEETNSTKKKKNVRRRRESNS